MHKPIRKAVFPVAGLGTRFLPATKAILKEVLPVVDQPVFQSAVGEELGVGIRQMIGRQALKAIAFSGVRHDCGSKVGYYNLDYAAVLSCPDMANDVSKIASQLVSIRREVI